jgi:hypothetical protein
MPFHKHLISRCRIGKRHTPLLIPTNDLVLHTKPCPAITGRRRVSRIIHCSCLKMTWCCIHNRAPLIIGRRREARSLSDLGEEEQGEVAEVAHAQQVHAHQVPIEDQALGWILHEQSERITPCATMMQLDTLHAIKSIVGPNNTNPSSSKLAHTRMIIRVCSTLTRSMVCARFIG